MVSEKRDSDDAVQFVYVTASNRDEAMQIAKTVVSERLAACANVIDAMRSVYWWNGELQEDDEAVLIFKTRRALIPDLTARIQELHSYDCPCVVALDITDGNNDYFKWVIDETSGRT